jgi:hypothetical protein
MKFWVSAILLVVVAILIRHQNKVSADITSEIIVAEMVDSIPLAIDQDSILQVKAIEKALKTFVEEGNFEKDLSSKLYFEDLSGNSANVQMDYGFILSTTERHLQLIQYQKQKNVAWFYESGGSELSLIGQISWNPEIEGMALLDINGDGYKDAITKEGSFYDIFILQRDTRSFSSPIKLRNPCFAPKEQLVRLFEVLGADTIYSKMKWDNNQLIPVEFIYPHPDNAFWKLKTTERTDKVSPENASVLWYLPKEYRTVAACVDAAVQ